MKRHRRTASFRLPAPSRLDRLWMLRALVPLGAHRTFVRRIAFMDDDLPRWLGLGREGDGDELDLQPREVRARLQAAWVVAEADAARCAPPAQLARNVQRIGALVGLDDTARRILEFVALLHTRRCLEAATDQLGPLEGRQLVHVVARLLDLPDARVRVALGQNAPLAHSGLVSVDRNEPRSLHGKLKPVTPAFADRLCSEAADPVQLLRDRVRRSAAPELALDSYPHVGRTLDILRPWLRHALDTRRAGVNVLVHGRPGTGKTQLARVLAADAGCDLFEVATEDEGGDPITGRERLRALRTAQCLLARHPALLLFDEVEDVFEAVPPLLGRGTAGPRKGWMNRMLESNPVPALWLSNSITDLDPAFIRRFDLVFELPLPPRRQRAGIIASACGDLLPPARIARLAECEDLTPAVVGRAASVLHAVADRIGHARGADALEHLIDNTLAALRHPPLARYEALRLPDLYDPAFVNTDTPIDRLAAGLARSRAGRLCFHGPPGTGKTAAATWIAHTLDVPLLVRRGSDLISMWVGATEKNLARAFREAAQAGAVLLIDEVDGFLGDRRGALRSWEVTAVNEMLTQMEAFRGVFIASTNLVERLDPASLRRFDVKLRFDCLRREQSAALMVRACAALGVAAPSTDDLARVARLGSLTPGDFATALRQHCVRPVDSAAMLAAVLEAECDLKQSRGSAIGFLR